MIFLFLNILKILRNKKNDQPILKSQRKSNIVMIADWYSSLYIYNLHQKYFYDIKKSKSWLKNIIKLI